MAQVTISLDEFRKDLVPPYCLLTGEPTDESKIVQFHWMPWWTYLIAPIGLIAFISAMSTTFKMKVVLMPMSGELRLLMICRRLIFLFLLVTHFLVSLVLIGMYIKSTTTAELWTIAYIGLTSVLLHLANVIIVQNYRLRVVQVDRHSITFGGVHPTFVDVLRTARRLRAEETR
jgi:hypothetical protein